MKHLDVFVLAELVDRAGNVFGSRDEGLRWLCRPALALDGQRPADLLSTREGCDLVKDLLTRIEYGVYC